MAREIFEMELVSSKRNKQAMGMTDLVGIVQHNNEERTIQVPTELIREKFVYDDFKPGLQNLNIDICTLKDKHGRWNIRIEIEPVEKGAWKKKVGN